MSGGSVAAILISVLVLVAALSGLIFFTREKWRYLLWNSFTSFSVMENEIADDVDDDGFDRL